MPDNAPYGAFESDSYMGRTNGTMPPRPVYCPACKTEHVAPVSWNRDDRCPSHDS